MIERPKMVALIVVLSAVGLGLLYAYASTIPPLQMSPGEVGPGHAGKLVEVSGVVSSARVLASGDALLTVVDETGSGSVVIVMAAEHVASGACFVPGDRITARGIVELYREEAQIVPSSKDDVVLLSREEILRPGPDVLLPSIALYEGLVVETHGTVTTWWMEEEQLFFVLDLGGGKGIVVRSPPARVENWDSFVVEGVVSYDDTRGWWFLECLSIV